MRQIALLMAMSLLGLSAVGSLAPAAEPTAAVKPADAATVEAVRNLQPGHWYEVAGSHLEEVAFKQWPAVKHGGVGAVMAAWCGAAYDTKRDRLIVWGGGHSDYAGNEIYVFDVRKLAWARINDPCVQLDDGKGETYPDGSPRSVHTYDHIEYIPALDRFVSMGLGATWPTGVGGGRTTWLFDFEAGKWETKSPRPGPRGAANAICGSAYDPVTGHEFVHTRGGTILEWDPIADKWTNLADGASGNYGTVGALDPIGRRYLAIGKGTRKDEPGRLICSDVSGREKPQRRTIAPKGPDDIPNSFHPGLDYDPVLDKVVGWHGGADVFLLDLERMEWEKVKLAETNKVTPTAAPRAGTYGRFRYIPSMNLYIAVNSVKENVFLFRLTDRARQPVPKRFEAALMTSKDAKLVKWVAGQVALWPKDKAGPLLKAALEGRKGDAEIVKALEDALKRGG